MLLLWPTDRAEAYETGIIPYDLSLTKVAAAVYIALSSPNRDKAYSKFKLRLFCIVQ